MCPAPRGWPGTAPFGSSMAPGIVVPVEKRRTHSLYMMDWPVSEEASEEKLDGSPIKTQSVSRSLRSAPHPLVFLFAACRCRKAAARFCVDKTRASIDRRLRPLHQLFGNAVQAHGEVGNSQHDLLVGLCLAFRHAVAVLLQGGYLVFQRLDLA